MGTGEIFEEENVNMDIVKLIQLIDINEDKKFGWREVHNFVQIVPILHRFTAQSSSGVNFFNKNNLPRVNVSRSVALVLQSVQGFFMPALDRIIYEIIRLSDSDDDGMSMHELLEWTEKRSNIE